MTITIPDKALEGILDTPEQARIELAAFLYASGRVPFVRARKIAGLERIAMLRELGRREIAIYHMEDYEADMRTLSEWPFPQASAAKSQDT
jgi:predicted HTH domain antitoxin